MLRLNKKATHALLKRLRSVDAQGHARIFSALADPMRLKIVMLMRGQKDLCVTDIAELLDASLPLVSHHLRILKEASVITVKRDGQMQCYYLTHPNINTIVSVLFKQRKGVNTYAMPSM